MIIEFDEKQPIYLQIMDLIKRDIVSGKLKEGDKLPSVREMAEKLKVNPNTVQRAYQELEREKVTFIQRGMGTFITKDEGMISALKKKMAKDVLDAFINGMKELGFSKDEILHILKNYIEKGDPDWISF